MMIALRVTVFVSSIRTGIVHGLSGLHALGERLVALVRDKGVVQRHDDAGKVEIFIIYGKIEKGYVALVVFEKFKRFRGDAVDEAELHVRIFFVILGDIVDEAT